MHYGAFHFSKNGNPTIFVKNGKGLVVNFEMGKGFTFSQVMKNVKFLLYFLKKLYFDLQGDIKGLNLLYKCPKD
jgi:hypothetical protein